MMDYKKMIIEMLEKVDDRKIRLVYYLLYGFLYK